jgi:hypothetical protein
MVLYILTFTFLDSRRDVWSHTLPYLKKEIALFFRDVNDVRFAVEKWVCKAGMTFA